MFCLLSCSYQVDLFCFVLLFKDVRSDLLLFCYVDGKVFNVHADVL